MDNETKKQLQDLQNLLNKKLLELDKLEQKKQDIVNRFKNANQEDEINSLQNEMNQNIQEFASLEKQMEDINSKVLQLKSKLK